MKLYLQRYRHGKKYFPKLVGPEPKVGHRLVLSGSGTFAKEKRKHH